jgi:hypothetical protein
VPRTVDLDVLSPGELDELAWLLRDEAARGRRRLPVEEAWAAFHAAPLTPAWERSQLADVGRVRAAARWLIIGGWRPEQIIDAMLAVAIHVSPDKGVAEEAVAAGVVDGNRVRGG